MSTRIAIIGTGNVGGNLGTTLAKAGVPVCFGLREGADGSALLERAPSAEALPVAAAAAQADVVALCVPAGVAVEAAKALGDLDGKVLLDCTNPVRWDQGPVWDPPAEGSVAAALAAAFSGAKVVKGFNTFGAEIHGDPKLAGTSAEVPLAGDEEARRIVSGIAEAGGFRPIDAGPLRNAAVLENHAVLWIHLATVGGRGRDFAFVGQGR